MPFKEIKISEIIKQNCDSDEEFKRQWEESEREYAIIGQLTALREKQKLSQKELAERMNSSQQAVSRIESREINPSLRAVCSMANSLGYELRLVPKENTP